MSARYGVFRARVNRRAAVLGAVGLLLAGGAGAQNTGKRPVRIAMLGDSLTAGFGVKASESLPSRLESVLRAQGEDVSITNHGVSGDTTEGGLQRIDWMLSDSPDIVIVALGANDALRGLDPQQAERNLDEILTRLGQKQVSVVLAGMLAPRNYGSTYTTAFDGLYPRLARKHGVTLYPFLLDGVAMDPGLNQPDGIHPNPRGVDVIAQRLAPVVRASIAGWRQRAGKGAG